MAVAAPVTVLIEYSRDELPSAISWPVVGLTSASRIVSPAARPVTAVDAVVPGIELENVSRLLPEKPNRVAGVTRSSRYWHRKRAKCLPSCFERRVFNNVDVGRVFCENEFLMVQIPRRES